MHSGVNFCFKRIVALVVRISKSELCAVGIISKLEIRQNQAKSESSTLGNLVHSDSCVNVRQGVHDEGI